MEALQGLMEDMKKPLDIVSTVGLRSSFASGFKGYWENLDKCLLGSFTTLIGSVSVYIFYISKIFNPLSVRYSMKIFV